MAKKFSSEFDSRGTVKVTDKLMIQNIDTGAIEYTTVAELLTFPAVQVPNANVNALDDYKEGTWTPAITFGGAASGILYHVNTAGNYTKIGNMVFASAIIILTNKGASSGTALITGLPANAAQYAPVTLRLKNISFADQFMGYVNQSASTIALEEVTNAGVFTVLTNADFANDSEILMTATYRV